MASWKTARVFISSTFRDMHAERDHLVKVVFPRVRAWCEARRLHLVDIDLRWGVTKEEADNGKAIEICLKEIDGSRPFFVCILGNRYGWVPEDLPSEDQYVFRESLRNTNMSITHMEIIHATESPLPRIDNAASEVCAHSFFYFRDPMCIPKPEDIPEPARAEFEKTFYEQVPAYGDSLRALKDDICAKFSADDRVFTYRGDWNADASNLEDGKLVGRLTNLDIFGQRVEADLIRGISAQFADHIAALSDVTDPLAEERGYHEAFIENRTQVHVPRADVETALSEYASGESTRPLVLSGPPGSGKSAVLANWVKQNTDLETGLAIRDDKTFVLARFIGASPASTNLARLLGNLCEELKAKYDLEEEIEDTTPSEGPGQSTTRSVGQSMSVPADPIEILKQWPKFLNAAAQKGKVLIVIDAINQLDRTTDPTRLYWLPRELPADVRLIVSVLDHGDISKEEYRPKPTETPDWLNMLRRMKYPEVSVPELDAEGRRKIIRELPSVFCKSLDDAQITSLLENDATKNPLFLTVSIEELRVFGSFERLAERIADLPRLTASTGFDSSDAIDSAIEAIFAQVLDRLESETDLRAPGLVPMLFAYLASAREGVSEDELGALLARKLPAIGDGERIGATQVVLRQVRQYLMRKGSLVDFYHRSFWKAVRTKYLASVEVQHAAHVEIAEYFDKQDWFAESIEAQRERAKRLPATPRPTNLRKVVELPWQRLNAAGVWNARGPDTAQLNGINLESDYTALESLFTTLDFLEAKNEAGLVFDLAEEYREAIDAIPKDHEQRRILHLLEEALRRDIHFIARHNRDYPQALFQCLWNTCWWFDCPDAAKHYVEPEGGWKEPAPWHDEGYPQLWRLLDSWRRQREYAEPGVNWIRAERPPAVHLGSAQRMVLRGHEDFVESVAFSPDGSKIVSGSKDKTARVWNARSGEELLCLHGHDGVLSSAMFSPDLNKIVSGSWDNTVRVWDAQLGQELFCLRGHESAVKSVAFSPDGARICTASLDKTIRIWDLQSKQELRCLHGHEKDVECVAFSGDGTMIVSGSKDKTVRLWEAVSGQELRCLRGHESTVCSVAISTDGTRVVSGSLDYTVRVWDARSGYELHCLRGHESAVTSVAFSTDGSRIASGSWDMTVQVWNSGTGEDQFCLRGHDRDVQSVAFSPDGSKIVSGSMDKTVRVWDTQSGQDLRRLRGHQPAVRSAVYYSPDGSKIVSAVADETARVWDSRSGQELHCLRGHNDRVECVSFSPDGSKIVSGSRDKTVRVWDTQSGQELFCLCGHFEDVKIVAFSPDGTKICSITEKILRVWDVYSAQEQHCLRGHFGPVECMAFSSDSSKIVSGSWDRTVRIWDARSGQELYCLRGHKEKVTSVAFSADSSKIVSGSWDETVRIWDAKSGQELNCFRVHENIVESVAFSADGSKILSRYAGKADKTVRIWDARFGNCIQKMIGVCDIYTLGIRGQTCHYMMLSLVLESDVCHVGSDVVVARYPTSFLNIASHPKAQQWAGTEAGHLHIITLEGGDNVHVG